VFAFLATTTIAKAIGVQALSTLTATITANILTLLTRAAASAISGRTLDATTATAAQSTKTLFAYRNGSSERSRADRAARHDECIVC
jgi:hypothetical protein